MNGIEILKKRMDKITKETDFNMLVDLLDTAETQTSSPHEVEKMLHKLPVYYAIVAHLYDLSEKELLELSTKEELILSKLNDSCEAEIFKLNQEKGMTASTSKPSSKKVNGMILQLSEKAEKTFKEGKDYINNEKYSEGRLLVFRLVSIRKAKTKALDNLSLLKTLKSSWDKKIETAISTVNLIGHLLKRDMYVIKDSDGYKRA